MSDEKKPGGLLGAIENSPPGLMPQASAAAVKVARENLRGTRKLTKYESLYVRCCKLSIFSKEETFRRLRKIYGWEYQIEPRFVGEYHVARRLYQLNATYNRRFDHWRFLEATAPDQIWKVGGLEREFNHWERIVLVCASDLNLTEAAYLTGYHKSRKWRLKDAHVE